MIVNDIALKYHVAKQYYGMTHFSLETVIIVEQPHVAVVKCTALRSDCLVQIQALYSLAKGSGAKCYAQCGYCLSLQASGESRGR